MPTRQVLESLKRRSSEHAYEGAPSLGSFAEMKSTTNVVHPDAWVGDLEKKGESMLSPTVLLPNSGNLTLRPQCLSSCNGLYPQAKLNPYSHKLICHSNKTSDPCRRHRPLYGTFDIMLLFLPLKEQVTRQKSKICLHSEVPPVRPSQLRYVLSRTFYLSTRVSWEDSANQGSHPLLTTPKLF